METQLVELDLADWNAATPNEAWIAELEAGKVLYFPKLGFELLPQEHELLAPSVLAEGVRNISLDAEGRLKGAAGDEARQKAVAEMVGRFRTQARQLIHGLLPHYTSALRLAPTSYRPVQVETRVQSWRADDRRLHVDAFPSRPNYGERILRVFTNVNPENAPRVWRVGEPFETVARRFLPRAKPYSRWQARWLRTLRVTKSFRSEYDHLMLQLHDGMKSDLEYQKNAPQETVPFPAGSVWVCFSDQTSHAVMSGQYMLEQTLHLPAARQYNPDSSPLAILSRLTGRTLV
ncbi:Kdo hydroxylase family protein [Variovorax sp. JS1663]|uniref:Kdo hydroxylase family protein n=1 Tax=Variovorax sp. JS1663 TaxID=1851577 RepID=UPI000B341B10|nr:Kdo hydroxylase family protein [Variovorax sp. JS1663]OUM01105.1 3-deoxy-D-manno-oct-2-ulosonic acid (Kdo) hydroxylase [Variovorax sp. JS1663]